MHGILISEERKDAMSTDDHDIVLSHDGGDFDVEVDGSKFGPESQEMADFLDSRVIGQSRATRHLARCFAMHRAGLTDVDQPMAVAVFAGPTGVGKTMAALELSRFLIDPDAKMPPLTRIPCGDMTERHQVAEIKGSPPGYIGFDQPARLCQHKIDEFHFQVKVKQLIQERFKGKKKPKNMKEWMARAYLENKPYTSVILFDEFDRAHRNLHNTLLHVIDDGVETMANGSQTLFENSVIILTCNIGSEETSKLLTGDGKMGFQAPRRAGVSDAEVAEQLDKAIYDQTLSTMKKLFPPEFVGRIRNDIIVFRHLEEEDCREVMELMLARVSTKLSGRETNGSRAIPLVVLYSDEFKEFLLERGSSREFGLRPMKKAVAKYVTLQLANAIESGELEAGDVIMFQMEGPDKPVLRRKSRVVASPILPVGVSSAGNGNGDPGI